MAYKPKLTPEWNRDEEEYKDLNEIQDHVRWYSRKIRQGALLENILKYHGELVNFFKWLRPYLKKGRYNKEILKIEALLEIALQWINEGKKKMKYGYVPPNFSLAFNILERGVEYELNDLKVKLDMGVRSTFTKDREKIERERMRRSGMI